MNQQAHQEIELEAAVPGAARADASFQTVVAVATAAAALQACGGGGGGNDGVATPPAQSESPTRAQASRQLGTAGFGGNAVDIESVRELGIEGWLDRQFAMPRSQGHVDWMQAHGYYAEPPNDGNIDRTGVERSIWRTLISSPDVLRQRVTLALSEIFVISLIPIVLPYRGFAAAAFMDILEANAFGNYRTLLSQVSQSPAMGKYLSFMDNKKANASGSMPDENYAREVMQLFSIGLVKLQRNGQPDLSTGKIEPTYTQADVTQLARVFTGWTRTRGAVGGPAYNSSVLPMNNVAANHEPGESNFLGAKVPAGTSGADSLQIAIDTLMTHPSMAPFIGRQLIQRLVVSDPSAAYVDRVAKAFEGDRTPAGRGDLRATLTAIFIDEEARSDAPLSAPTRGKLREPMVRFIQWARTFGLQSPDEAWAIGNLSDVVKGLAQSPIRSPSVFNFFRPGYVPPASELGSLGIAAPEFQITNETTVSSYLNFMQRVVGNGIGGMTADYSALVPLVADSAALLAELNVLLAAGQISQATLAGLATALDTIDVSTQVGRDNRIRGAVMLVMAAPEYLVQK